MTEIFVELRPLFKIGVGGNNGKTKIRIRLKAYEHRILDQSADKIVETAKELELAYLVQFHCQLNAACTRSSVRPHKYKDSPEQFEMRTHKRLIDIVNPTPKQLTLNEARLAKRCKY